jgi:hypothetical protein
MTQQINLYQPMLREQRRALSAASMLQVSAALVAGLLLVYGYGSWRLQGLAGEVGRLAAARDAAAARLAQMERELPRPERSASLAAEVERLGRELAGKQRLVGMLGTGEIGSREGFSAHLAGLARQHVDGTWMTAVEIARGGASLSIQGRATRAELVPEYVQRLGQEQALVGARFATVRLEDGDGQVRFRLGTESEEE